jgi:hypothetical protein
MTKLLLLTVHSASILHLLMVVYLMLKIHSTEPLLLHLLPLNQLTVYH